MMARLELSRGHRAHRGASAQVHTSLMDYFLGIDGGGTRTTAWLADGCGRIVARAEAGPSNPVKVGFAPAQHQILRAARSALHHRGLKSRPKISVVVAGLAGVDRAQVHRQFLVWLKKTLPARHHLLVSDAEIALASAIGGAPGIIVVSGTGSIAMARDRKGGWHRAGGWGSLFDDPGSGYDIGRKAVTAALRALDGRGPRTRLQALLPRALKIAKLTDVVSIGLAPHRIAALFPVVHRAARFRDRVARAILREAGSDLASLAVALAHRLRWSQKEFNLVCSGGVFCSSSLVRRVFAAEFCRACPRAKIMILRNAPVLGAIAMAKKLAKQP